MTSPTSSVRADPVVYLVAMHDSPAASHAAEVACSLSAALRGSAELHLLHVFASLPTNAPLMASSIVEPADLLESGRQLLDRAAAYAAGHFQGRLVGHLRVGDPWREIVQMASDLRVDLIVVGTAGRTGIARMALGSVAERVVRHAGCPVLVVRATDYSAHADGGSDDAVASG